MTDETTTEATESVEAVEPTDTPEMTSESIDEPSTPDDPEMFPREVVEKLRQENGKYRQRAQQADTLAHRLHLELVRATGRLADPSDLEYAEEYLDDPDALTAAIDELLDRKPHLATRRPSGDIGQGQRGAASAPFSAAGIAQRTNVNRARRRPTRLAGVVEAGRPSGASIYGEPGDIVTM